MRQLRRTVVSLAPQVAGALDNLLPRGNEMSHLSQTNQLSLERVLRELKNSDPVEYHEIRFVALKVVAFFNKPAHEIAIASLRDRLRFFPLFLSHLRIPQYLIEILAKDAERLASKGEVIQENTRHYPRLPIPSDRSLSR